MSQGTVIVLNGTSSSGKSTLAGALQQMLPGYYFHTGIDHWIERSPRSLFVASDGVNPATADGFLWIYAPNERVTEIRLGRAALNLWCGMYAAIAAMARCGNSLIVDDLIWDARVLGAAARALRDLDAFFVGVRCARAAAEGREERRGDRSRGLVAAHYELIHAHGRYDLEVDTAASTPEECARTIARFVATGKAPTAFRALAGA